MLRFDVSVKMVSRAYDLIRELGGKHLPYLYGGSSPVHGFDCSGLIWYILNAIGVGGPRLSAAGYYSRMANQVGPDPKWGAIGHMLRFGFYGAPNAKHITWRPHWSMTIESNLGQNNMDSAYRTIPDQILYYSFPSVEMGYSTLIEPLRPTEISSIDRRFVSLLDMPLHYREPAYFQFANDIHYATLPWYEHRYPTDTGGRDWWQIGYDGFTWVSDGFSGLEHNYHGIAYPRKDIIRYDYIRHLLVDLRRLLDYWTRRGIIDPVTSEIFYPAIQNDFFRDYQGRTHPGHVVSSEYIADLSDGAVLNSNALGERYLRYYGIIARVVTAAIDNVHSQLENTAVMNPVWSDYYRDMVVVLYDNLLQHIPGLKVIVDTLSKMMDPATGPLGERADHKMSYSIECSSLRSAMWQALPSEAVVGGLSVNHSPLGDSGVERYLPYDPAWIPNSTLAILNSSRSSEAWGSV